MRKLSFPEDHGASEAHEPRQRAVMNSVARIWMVRGGPIAIALLLTPGLGGVVTTVPMSTSPLICARGTVGCTASIWNVRSTGGAYVPFTSWCS